MITPIENGQLLNDIDCQSFNINNLGALNPVPSGLVASTDPRLSDARNPLPGSVLDASVGASAAIVQSKINFNGNIPAAWLGVAANQAATGSLAEYKSNKGVANGYPSLDGTGKVPASQMPVGAGTGTVTSVGISMPSDFNVASSPVTGAGTIAITRNAVPANSWFGNPSGSSQAPTFQSSVFPVPLIPNLPASIITSGVFALGQIPSLPATQITSGVFALAQIPSLPASQITSGTFAPAQIPPLDASIIATGSLAPARGGLPVGGVAGQTLSKIDGTNFNAQWASPVAANYLQSAVLSPSGTNNTSGIMMGLSVPFTPQKSGKVVVICTGNGNNGVSSATYKVGIGYGTGAAPANGAAPTGTLASQGVQNTSGSAGEIHPFSVAAIVSITVGTAYWFDLVLTSSGGGSSTLTSVQFFIFEF